MNTTLSCERVRCGRVGWDGAEYEDQKGVCCKQTLPALLLMVVLQAGEAADACDNVKG